MHMHQEPQRLLWKQYLSKTNNVQKLHSQYLQSEYISVLYNIYLIFIFNYEITEDEP